MGVVAIKTTSDIASVPIYTTLTFAPKVTLDTKSGGIALPYLSAAGIPATAYYYKDAQTLTCCDDIYVMPHADPTWATHSNLHSWNLTCKGAIWSGCHAVSVLENMNNGSLQTNFLMNNKTSVGTAAVPFGTHADGTIPFTLGEQNEPVMQFIGKTDLAQLNGSEQIYLPQLSWRASTKIGIWDDTQANVPGLSPGKAAKLAFGQGLGDPARGKVMYEGGHSIGGSGPDNIAAQRAFLNFILWASQDKAIKVAVTGVPSLIPGGSTVSGMKVSVTAPVPASPFKYEWVSSCGGSFSNATGTFNNPSDGLTATLTNFTAPTAPTTSFQCVISCKITDACGRVSFVTQTPTIQSVPAPPVAVNDYKTTKPETVVSVSPLGNDSDPNNDPLTLTLTGAKTTSNGQFALAADGKTVMYKPNPGFIGKDSIQYKICDPGPLCTTAYVVINVGEDPGPCGTGKELAVIGTGYGYTLNAQTGTISNPLDALGSFNSKGTKLAKKTNSSITIDLGYMAYKDDKILLKLASGDSKGTTFSVTSGALAGTLSDNQSFKNIIKANSFGSYNYVIHQDSVRYLKIAVASTNLYDSYVDGVSYPIRGCILKCSASEKTVKLAKSAASVFAQTGVSSPTNAVGSANNSGAELTKASTDVLTLDLGEVVPQGATILVYLATKSATTIATGVTFPVSSSLDGVTFSGSVNHQIISYSPQFTPCKYVVSQASGVRYIKISAPTGTTDGQVDAVTYTSVKCLPISPVAKNDTVKICEDNAYAFDPRTNDYDPQNLPLSIKITSAPTNGLAMVDISGKITFVPNKDFNGSDQIKYQVCNTSGFCSEATIFITIPDDGCAVGTYKPTIFTPQTATITLGEDTFLDQNSPDKNNGIATTLSVNTRAGQVNRSLIKFSIGSASIPADAVITSATLRLYKTGSKTETVKVYRETTAWTEGTFNNATGDPSWNEVTSGNKWLSGTGGDYDSTHLVVSKLIPVTNGIYVDFDVSSLAKQWIDGGLPNQGPPPKEVVIILLYLIARKHQQINHN
jgi:Bacterial Ig domain